MSLEKATTGLGAYWNTQVQSAEFSPGLDLIVKSCRILSDKEIVEKGRVVN